MPKYSHICCFVEKGNYLLFFFPPFQMFTLVENAEMNNQHQKVENKPIKP